VVVEVEEEQENLIVTRTRFQKSFIVTGLTCLILGVLIIFMTVFMEKRSNEFFIASLISGILFGAAFFFEGYGYYLLPKDYGRTLAYFGSPLLYQVIRVLYRVPYVLLCYNGFLVAGRFNIDLIVILALFYFPYVVSRVACRWSRLQKWLRSLDTSYELEESEKNLPSL
jgi:uncharacterized membrane protein (UPF0136 family)